MNSSHKAITKAIRAIERVRMQQHTIDLMEYTNEQIQRFEESAANASGSDKCDHFILDILGSVIYRWNTYRAVCRTNLLDHEIALITVAAIIICWVMDAFTDNPPIIGVFLVWGWYVFIDRRTRIRWGERKVNAK